MVKLKNAFALTIRNSDSIVSYGYYPLILSHLAADSNFRISLVTNVLNSVVDQVC